jgi:hypothetical protein
MLFEEGEKVGVEDAHGSCCFVCVYYTRDIDLACSYYDLAIFFSSLLTALLSLMKDMEGENIP